MEKVHAFTTFQSGNGKMSKNALVKVEILILLFFLVEKVYWKIFFLREL